MMKIAGTLFVVLMFLWAPGANSASPSAGDGPVSITQAGKTMKIRMTINGQALSATLLDNASSRDFAALLPVTVTLEDYAGTEKIVYLSRKLSVTGAPSGFDPSVGDITYYAPWGNIAIFYKDFGYSKGLIPLGRIDAGSELLRSPGKLSVQIELTSE